MPGVTLNVLVGSSPSCWVMIVPASSCDAICADAPQGTSSTRESAAMAAFGSVMKLGARVLRLLRPLRRQLASGRRTDRDLAHALLERGPRILPRKYVLLDVLPQPVEVAIRGAPLPELHNGRGRLAHRHPTLDQVGENDEGTHEGLPRSLAELGEHFQGYASLQRRSSSRPLGLAEARSQSDPRVELRMEEGPHRSDDVPVVRALAGPLECLENQRPRRDSGDARRIDDHLDDEPRIGLEARQRVGVLRRERRDVDRDSSSQRRSEGKTGPRAHRHHDADPPTRTTEFGAPRPSSGARGADGSATHCVPYAPFTTNA